MRKNGKIISYHVFTDGVDEYPGTLKKANEIFRKWKADGAQNIRIYKLTSEDTLDIDDVPEEEHVRSIGDFPF